jgi:competence protein ComEC
MLDVGQGDSLLIITPEKKTILIDSGLSKASEQVLRALDKHNIKQIDLVVATHPHADHIGAMSKILDAVSVKMFLDSGQAHPTVTYEKMLATIKRTVGKINIARAGQEFELDSGIKLTVVNPSEPLLEKVRGSEENANSVVFRLVFGDFEMLFTGDSEEETEERLLETGTELTADVLKVAHHGSQYATTEEFLQRVQPKAALISCGSDNDYGHPNQKTLDRLKKAGVEIHRTDLEGELTVTSDGKDFQIEPEHPAAGSVWKGRTAK